MTSSRPSSNLSQLRQHLTEARRIVILTGAGVSAESGVPTFRGAGGLWRQFSAPDLASPVAFDRDPSLVWEFYHYRREVMRSKLPNAAHLAIADFQKRLDDQGRRCTVITQNIDELHTRAGSSHVIELHGSLFRVRCIDCDREERNEDSPISESLKDCGDPSKKTEPANIPVDKLPRCSHCRGLLRPAVVWFGEGLEADVLDRAEAAVEACDVCLIVGTSSVVYPAARFAPDAAARGSIVAEFNTEETGVTRKFHFYFEGPCGQTLPPALAE